VIALLRKDAPWLLVMLLLGSTALTIAWVATGFAEIWLFQPQRMRGPYHVAWVAGLALGIVASGWDDLLGTRDYLRHRPLGRLRLHGARVLGCALVLAAWMAVPPLVHWGIESMTGLAAFGHPGHVLDVWACSSVAWSACGVALFASALPCGVRLRLFACGAALLSVFFAAETIGRTEAGPHDAATFACIHGVAAFAFGALSFATALRDTDADRPWPGRARRVAAAATATVVAFAGNAGLALRELAGLRAYHLAAPFVARVGGDYRLIVRTDAREAPVLIPVDATHRAVGDALAGDSVRALWSPRDGLDCRGPGFDDPWFHSGRSENRFAGLDDDGLYRRLCYDSVTRRPRFVVAGKGPAMLPFTGDARVLDCRGAGSSVWIAEPGAAELWRLDPDASSFTAVPLPDGDHLTRVQYVRPGNDRDRLEVGDLHYQLVEGVKEALVGEHGAYLLAESGPVHVPSWMQAALARQGADERRERVELVDDDLLAPRVRAFDAGGAVRFEHDYGPRTSAEIREAGLALACSAQRPPLLQAAALLVAAHPRPRLLDPLLTGARRPWLAAATLACAGLWALLGALRLRRIGADAATRRFWSIATLLLGPAAFVAGCCIERRRCHAGRDVTPGDTGPGAPPRIVSSEFEGAPCTEQSPARS
jgi:hypothetical protein